MSLWIKICGNTSLADAQLAVDAGADAVGFVFAPSPRRVTSQQVAAITPQLPRSTEKIGVFVESDFSAIVSTVEESRLTGVQLHAGAHFDDQSDKQPSDLSEKLRTHFGSDLRILQVIHYGSSALAQLECATSNPYIDGVLVDSRTATAVGGTGIPFDWQSARATIFNQRPNLKLIAAGGLSPLNVAEAITMLRPWGIDVASGVEEEPGKKAAAKILAFITNARTASFEQTTQAR
jgi:phosphoribosylanthranilate isomerase